MLSSPHPDIIKYNYFHNKNIIMYNRATINRHFKHNNRQIFFRYKGLSIKYVTLEGVQEYVTSHFKKNHTYRQNLPDKNPGQNSPVKNLRELRQRHMY